MAVIRSAKTAEMAPISVKTNATRHRGKTGPRRRVDNARNNLRRTKTRTAPTVQARNAETEPQTPCRKMLRLLTIPRSRGENGHLAGRVATADGHAMTRPLRKRLRVGKRLLSLSRNRP